MNISQHRRAMSAGVLGGALLLGLLVGAPTVSARPLATPPPSPSMGPADPEYADAIALGQKELQAIIAKLGASMASIALVSPDSILWSQAMGTVSGPGTTATLTTTASVGSVSKNFAAISVMQLVDAGKVKLDAPVTRYIPDFTMASPAYRTITVRMLLDHTAGFAGTNMVNSVTLTPWPGYSDATLAFLKTQRLKAKPGAVASYCNDCYTVAGILVERVSGKSYPQYVQDAVFTPLGMTNSAFAVRPFADGQVARLTMKNGSTLPVDYDNFYAAGGVYSTPTDMGALAQMYLNDGVFNGTRILSKRAIAEMGTWQVADTLNPIPDARNAVKFGLGWDTVEVLALEAAGVTAWQKGGDSATSHAAFIVAPSAELAVIVQAVSLPPVTSGVLQDIGQTVLLQALVDSGQIAKLPPVVVSVPPEVTPTAAQVSAMLGQYPQAAFRYKVVQGPGTSLQVAKLTAAGWTTQKPQFTLRTDGLWWSTGKVPTAISVYPGRGRNYLVLTSPGGYGQFLADVYLGEEVSPAKPLSRVWQARLGEQWVPVNQAAVSWLWFENPVRTFKAIPGLPGYAIAAGVVSNIPVSTSASNRVGAMFLRVPGESAGVDIYETTAVMRDGHEWMWFGNELTRPVATIPPLSSTPSIVTIGSEGYTEWRSVPAGTLVVTGDVAWRVFDSTFKPLTAGVGASSTISVPSGGFVAFFGGPGSAVTAAVS
ncbi:MAG: hypothetical protein QG597_5208 [Actinomycetota bacterium]|nr:hypothetical protein [Actinomycetota bacterium]